MHVERVLARLLHVGSIETNAAKLFEFPDLTRLEVLMPAVL